MEQAVRELAAASPGRGRLRRWPAELVRDRPNFVSQSLVALCKHGFAGILAGMHVMRVGTL